MATTKFTPGPWKRGHGAITSSTTDQDGDPIVIALPYGTSKRVGLKGVDEFSIPPQEVADANANLIAAAPEMYRDLDLTLTALRGLVSALTSEGSSPMPTVAAIVSQAEATLAKAVR